MRHHKHQANIEGLNEVAKLAAAPEIRADTDKAVVKYAEDIVAGKNETRARLRLYQLLMRDAVKVAGPDLFLQDFIVTKLLTEREKNSASASVVAFGHLKMDSDDPTIQPELDLLKKKKVVVKYAVAEEGYEAKMNELEIYRTVAKLVEHNYTPHVMLFVHGFKVNVSSIKKSGTSTELTKAVHQINAKHQAKEAVVIVTEAGNGSPYRDLVSKLSEGDHCAVYFQVLFTLDQLVHARVTHYDLHWGNVFLEKVDPASYAPFIYFVDNDAYVMVRNAAFLPRIYDWDLAFQEHLDPVGYHSHGFKYFCSAAGICPYTNAAYDVYRFLAVGMVYRLPRPLTLYVNSVLKSLQKLVPKAQARAKRDDRFILNKTTERGYLCDAASSEETCHGGILEYVSRKYGVKTMDEKTTPYLPWPRYCYMYLLKTLAKTHPKTFSVKSLKRDGFPKDYAPGTTLFASRVYFARQVDRSAIKVKL